MARPALLCLRRAKVAQVEQGGQGVLNQPAFNKALSLTPDRDIRVGVLPVLQFPSGYLFFRCAGQPYCRYAPSIALALLGHCTVLVVHPPVAERQGEC